MKKTYHGSCHCGAVRFACELDLAAGTTRCNCRFCTKARFWMTFVPTAAFRIESGGEALHDYQYAPPGKPAPFLHFEFCAKCGVRGFTRGGALPQFGGEFYAINLACLDDATDDELAAAPVKYADGKHDDWSREPAHRYL